MSISASMFNAYSGLTAAARRAEVIANNVSNAQTPGYGRREVQLTATSLNGRGNGVRIAGVARQVDQIAMADRRLAEAAHGASSARAGAYARLEGVIGIPGEAGSLSDLVTAFGVALSAAESRPDSEVRLRNVLHTANDLVTRVNRISDTTQDVRMDADAEIATQVTTLNKTLEAVSDLNRTIRLQDGGGKDINGLLDQRQVLIDQISGIVPIRTYLRDHNQIAITTTGGAVLLDGQVAEVGFTATGVITPDMTVGFGALSGLTLNGKPIGIPGGNQLMNGGALEALFDIRDQIAPDTGASADAIARNLIERFEDTGLDPTLLPGDPGLFTDAGSPLDTLLETGLAGRLEVNAAVDPDAGGAVWRLRDGLGAASVGSSGDNSLLSAMAARLDESRVTASPAYSARGLSAGGLADEFAALSSMARLEAEANQSFSASRVVELQATEMEAGVDTDQEMQNLLLVEQAYAANARVISTIDQMLSVLLEI